MKPISAHFHMWLFIMIHSRLLHHFKTHTECSNFYQYYNRMFFLVSICLLALFCPTIIMWSKGENVWLFKFLSKRKHTNCAVTITSYSVVSSSCSSLHVAQQCISASTFSRTLSSGHSVLRNATLYCIIILPGNSRTRQIHRIRSAIRETHNFDRTPSG